MHHIVHHVPEKSEHQYFVCNFDKFKCTDAMFGRPHPEETANLLVRQSPTSPISVFTISCKMKSCHNPLLHHKVRTKRAQIHINHIVNKKKIIINNSSIATLESVTVLEMSAVGLEAC